MNLNDILEYCERLKGSQEKMPFGEDNLVYTVHDKMFIIIDIADFSMINLKCDPEYAIELRERYEHIIPGYHMNKKHWNSIIFPNSIPSSIIKDLILHSYQLIVKSLPKKIRENLN